jgi:hypothetical protein
MPDANKKASMIADDTIKTGIAVDIIPNPIPLIITVAGPVTRRRPLPW